ncbi:hypothetical protein LT85_0645 [Collimonas arenae]|uniref:Uncharacterized protein n=1 Tax=Collimonas arenae TaxID=279058 RepID=A0A0A1F7Q2_9BURK|nr:hypothetical protein LT85_0645 [Collimonas arenae]
MFAADHGVLLIPILLTVHTMPNDSSPGKACSRFRPPTDQV